MEMGRLVGMWLLCKNVRKALLDEEPCPRESRTMDAAELLPLTNREKTPK